jgi:hypothetical protein
MPKKINKSKPRNYKKTGLIFLILLLFLCVPLIIWGYIHHKTVHNKLINNGSAQASCSSLLNSQCPVSSTTENGTFKNWILSQPTPTNPETNSPTQLSSCEYDATNPPRSTLPAGEISPAEKNLQSIARTFQSADAFGNYIQGLSDSERHNDFCIFDGWTATQFYNDAVSRR